MNLFNIIPSSFFNYLASGSNQVLHSNCLLVIYEQYEREISYRLPRLVIRDAIASYLMEHQEQLEDDGLNYNEKANEIIRKFCDENVGWLEEDNDDSTFEKYISMTEIGISLVEFLMKLTNPRKAEYSFFITNIYNAMRNENSWIDDPYIAVLKLTYTNARDLAKALKQLSTAIKDIIEEMTREETFETLTNNLIRYFDGEFIKEYSRLITQQNIHMYRSEICKQLDRMLETGDLLDTLVMGYMFDENEGDYGIAEDRVVEMIQGTKRFLAEDYDSIIDDIKHKITIYLNLARSRALFLRNQDEGMNNYIEQALVLFSEQLQNDSIKSFAEEEIDQLFIFDKYEFIDESSIRYPSKNTTITKPNETEIEVLSEELISEAILAHKNEANNPYSKEKMKKYLERIMGDKTRITSQDFPLESQEDLLSCIAATTYANENGYIIHATEGYFSVEKYLVKEFEIIKEVK